MSDKNEPKRRGWWSATQRDLEGARGMRDRAASQAERERDQRGQLDQLADAIDGDDGETDFEPIDTGVTEEMQRRIDSDPMLRLIFQKLNSERTRSANRVMEAMGKKPPAEELKTIKTRVNIMWAVLGIAVTAAGGSTIAVARWLKESGKSELQNQLLIEHDNDQERRLQQVEGIIRTTAQRLEDHIQYHVRGGRIVPRDPDDGRALTPDQPAPKLKP